MSYKVRVLLANLIPRDRGRLDDTLDAEILRDDHGCLLSDDERGPVSVRADITQRDGQVDNFESAHAVHIQPRIDDAASLSRLHRAGAELMRKHTRKMPVVNDAPHSKGERGSPSASTCQLPSSQKKKNE